MSNEPFTCGLDAALAMIGGKWKLLILYHLAHETRRYGALKRCLRGVSDKMLIQQLKELQADGVVDRIDYKEIPPRVDYSITPFGTSLARSLAPLCAWGEEHSAMIAALVDRRNGGLNLTAAEQTGQKLVREGMEFKMDLVKTAADVVPAFEYRMANSHQKVPLELLREVL